MCQANDRVGTDRARMGDLRGADDREQEGVKGENLRRHERDHGPPQGAASAFGYAIVAHRP